MCVRVSAEKTEKTSSRLCPRYSRWIGINTAAIFCLSKSLLAAIGKCIDVQIVGAIARSRFQYGFSLSDLPMLVLLVLCPRTSSSHCRHLVIARKNVGIMAHVATFPAATTGMEAIVK